MIINKHNYEAFFLDYHEGNLTPQQVADLLLFVEQHPELKEQFESFENFNLEDYSSYTFKNKESLKKEITEKNYEEYFMRSADDSLNAAEINLLQSFLKQHPQYLSEFHLYQKTKLVPEKDIVFENKQSLKRISSPVQQNADIDHLLISEVEGLLSPREEMLLRQHLLADSCLQKELELYKSTKAEADLAIVFRNKNELKRNDKRLVPFFYYWPAAAAVLLLFGLYFTFKNTEQTTQEVANNVIVPQKHAVEIPARIEKGDKKNNLASAVKSANNGVIKPNQRDLIVDSTNVSPVVNPIPENNIALIAVEKDEIQEEVISNEKEIVPALTNTVAKQEEKLKGASREFLSLGEMAAAKIKEKTLDPEVLAMEKRTGREKKFSGWDVLQVVAKGVSKMTGKKVEAKPTYNEQGEVTAFALGAGGFEFSKRK